LALAAVPSPSELSETLIVGAGPAGLAVGALLRRANAAFTVLERSARVADSWHRHYDRLHLHTPKRFSALPYRPFPRAYPRFPSRQQVIDYFADYARAFDIEPEVGRDVRRCVRAEDGTWNVETNRETFRARRIVMAAGFNRVPTLPRWPGLDTFTGKVIHSSEYTNGEAFRGSRVLVVGFGNSGAEIALDLAERGAHCTISVRGAVNVVPRQVLGIPITMFALASRPLPPRVADRLNRLTVRLTIGSLSSTGLVKSDVGPLQTIAERQRIPVIDVGTMARIRRGDIAVRRGIESFDGPEVCFADGTRERFDALVCATGFGTGLRDMLPDHLAVLDDQGVPWVHGRESAVRGLYFCGYNATSTGMLRQIGIEATAIGRAIAAEL
jgi:cation diffusion facilitator CzcD-associated flavoprotein CzcO